MPAPIQIRRISKRYGPTVIFEEASVVFSSADKIGVIGRNGAGKTTLCRLLLGEEEPDSGEIARSPRLRFGYLEQRNPWEAEESVSAFLERSSGKEPWVSAKMAARFRLKGKLLEQRIDTLPGGYQTRVKLAAMLLAGPDFLVLDEPTNYLDLRTLILLERLLRDFSGGFLIISHDREFLKRTCAGTLEVERGGLNLFPGDVEAYLAYKEEQRQQKVRRNRNIEARRKHLQEFVDRYRVRASTASRAQSKLKEIERLQPIEIEHPIGSVRIRLPPVEAKKGSALDVEDLRIGYPGRVVAEDIRFDIERASRIAVLGDNGEGKTTFLRTIAGQLPPLGGSYRWGHGLSHSYYAQHVYAALDPEETVLSYLEAEAARDVERQAILDLAGSFLFQGDAVHRPIAVLSGGERGRLCLAAMLLARRPVMLLDEPTNHLDFETVEALGTALRDYNGTIFFVSHDRTFVQLVATGILEVKDRTVTLYPGDYGSYVDRTIDEAEEAGRDDGEGEAGRPGRTTAKPADRRRLRRERRARIRRLEKEAREAEARIARYEEEKEEIDRHYLENPTDYSRDRQIRLGELQGLLAGEESRWLALQEELEEARRDE